MVPLYLLVKDGWSAQGSVRPNPVDRIIETVRPNFIELVLTAESRWPMLDDQMNKAKINLKRSCVFKTLLFDIVGGFT